MVCNVIYPKTKTQGVKLHAGSYNYKKYASYGKYNKRDEGVEKREAAGYGTYGSYNYKKYSSYGTYKRTAEWLKSFF
ncbi:hypothetical protein NW766_006518 [Fusarium irregulare]|uniref:Uncharacterized protein n=1 Tax=Fusarium irregulare TaxID=2494466 RepID=A0A9W8PRS3_9HYPO|nr:hypothetical protein NW766_006518 [Fusarium irregulare]